MSDRYFLDTNFLVYLFDARYPLKRATAGTIFRPLLKARSACLSTQVLSEFYVTVMQKLPTPLDRERATRILYRLHDFQIVPISSALVMEAVAIATRHQISYWDALIVAAAKEAGASVVLTEDLNHGQLIAGLRIHNPFKESL